MEQAKPALLEPIMNVEIDAPGVRRRPDGGSERPAGTHLRHGHAGATVITAQVPMAEMLTYQTT